MPFLSHLEQYWCKPAAQSTRRPRVILPISRAKNIKERESKSKKRRASFHSDAHSLTNRVGSRTYLRKILLRVEESDAAYRVADPRFVEAERKAPGVCASVSLKVVRLSVCAC